MFVLDSGPDIANGDSLDPLVEAGFLCSPLVTHPAEWINRRVETVEMLSHEETRRRVSVDLTLPESKADWPETSEGMILPISILSKQRRRNFDLRDATGAALPVLGRRQNSIVAHAAVLSSALDLTEPGSEEDLDYLAEQLWGVVTEPAERALDVAGALLDTAYSGRHWLKPLFADEAFIELFSSLAGGYILFALLPHSDQRRHIIKFGYGDDFDFTSRLREPRWRPDGLSNWVKVPDGQRFLIDCEVAHWAESFHLEIVIPEELRVSAAVLFEDTNKGPIPVGDAEVDVDRASLYSPSGAGEFRVDAALVELVPERSGQIAQRFSLGLLGTPPFFRTRFLFQGEAIA